MSFLKPKEIVSVSGMATYLAYVHCVFLIWIGGYFLKKNKDITNLFSAGLLPKCQAQPEAC